jgi:hypothetical protein
VHRFLIEPSTDGEYPVKVIYRVHSLPSCVLDQKHNAFDMWICGIIIVRDCFDKYILLHGIWLNGYTLSYASVVAITERL